MTTFPGGSTYVKTGRPKPTLVRFDASVLEATAKLTVTGKCPPCAFVSRVAIRGRKPKQESRAAEIRAGLAEWKRLPEFSRPSLRALACELGTSHQLLTFYLKRLDQWQANEYWRQAREIRARAIAEGRSMNEWEEQQVHAYTRAGVRATVGPMLLDVIKRLREESERRPLVWQEIKSLKILAPGFPEARDLLQKCSQNGVKTRKNNLPAVPCNASKSFRRD